MKIRDGCATVTGYKLPKATEPLFFKKQAREGGSEVKARSQDIDYDCARLLQHLERFSVKEKDEASRWNGFPTEFLNAFIPVLSESEGFLFSITLSLHTGLSIAK